MKYEFVVIDNHRITAGAEDRFLVHDEAGRLFTARISVETDTEVQLEDIQPYDTPETESTGLGDATEEQYKKTWDDISTVELLRLNDEFPFTKKRFVTKEKRWQFIAEEIKKNIKYEFTGEQCRCRNTTLESGFKRVEDNKKKTGRGRVKQNVSPVVQNMLAEKLLTKDRITLPNTLEGTDVVEISSLEKDIRETDIEEAKALASQTRHTAEKKSETAETDSDSSAADDPGPGTSFKFVKKVDRKRKSKTTSNKPTIPKEMKLSRMQRNDYNEKKLDTMKEAIAVNKQTNALLEVQNELIRTLTQRNQS